MKLIIGLGNPGSKYVHNRHNAGYLLVDRVQSSEFVAKKTDCFMNESGKFVKKLTTNYELPTTNLYIAHDDLDLKLGTYKIQFGVGPKVHNGISSIESALGGKDFWRIRIGVDNRDSDNRTSGEEYVLQDFTKEELDILEQVYAKVRNDIAKI
jgi:peptidyl-tRNA hydrolase, PTH1 family